MEVSAFMHDVSVSSNVAWTTEKDMENISGEGEQECWRDCYQSGVNPATPVYGDKPKLELID